MEPVLVPEVLDVLPSEEVWSEELLLVEVSSSPPPPLVEMSRLLPILEIRTPLRGSRALKWDAGKALMKDRRLRDRMTQTIKGLEDADGIERS